MDIRFDGKKALVTGASQGFGKEIALALVACGAETIAVSKTQANLDLLKAECPTIQIVCVDLSDWDVARKVVQDLGPIDLLVNNAGILRQHTFLELTQEDFDDHMAIHVKAAINISQVVAKGMIERGQGGAIVNMASILSSRTCELLTSYCAAKGALDQVTRMMALELGPHQIRVNSVNPGFIKTLLTKPYFDSPEFKTWLMKKTPMNKPGDSKNVAHAVLYLLSDKADMIHGSQLHVEGGYMISP